MDRRAVQMAALVAALLTGCPAWADIPPEAFAPPAAAVQHKPLQRPGRWGSRPPHKASAHPRSARSPGATTAPSGKPVGGSPAAPSAAREGLAASPAANGAITVCLRYLSKLKHGASRAWRALQRQGKNMGSATCRAWLEMQQAIGKSKGVQ